jgi:F0F1-type ATP synthase membrane subunit c/vacuolar-type H+-ATPase subunit K
MHYYNTEMFRTLLGPGLGLGLVGLGLGLGLGLVGSGLGLGLVGMVSFNITAGRSHSSGSLAASASCYLQLLRLVIS